MKCSQLSLLQEQACGKYVCITDVGLYHQPPADLQVGIKISSELLRSINVFYVFNAALWLMGNKEVSVSMPSCYTATDTLYWQFPERIV